MFESIAYAAPATAAPQQPNPIVSFMPLILIFAIFYFMLIRPQQKRQKELQATVNALKKGDKVITNGGLIGTVSSLQEDYVVLKTGGNGDSNKIEVLKSAISGLRK